MITKHGWPVALTPLTWPQLQGRCGGPPTCHECAADHLAADLVQLYLAGDDVQGSEVVRSMTTQRRVDVLDAAARMLDDAMEWAKMLANEARQPAAE